MNTEFLKDAVKYLVQKNKGILAADESNDTCDKRLELVGINSSSEMRRQYRNMLFSTPNLNEFVSGVILYDETYWQVNDEEMPFPMDLLRNGIFPGIKVDLGAKDMPGFPEEKLTIGLDDLDQRVSKYAEFGARFAKWRAVIKIDESKGLPTDSCINANIDALARYALIAQTYNVVPVVEPEILLEGNHSIQISEKITTRVVSDLMKKLQEYKVFLPGLILKTSMVIQGNKNHDEASPQEIADATVRMLNNSCPKDLGGVVFLSGGQTPVEATAHLDAIAEKEPLNWEIAFSYARALQEPALKAWAGKKENIKVAQQEFTKRLELNQLADLGEYDISLEYLD
jgi:fructose-bisphosphate aldolase, class I